MSYVITALCVGVCDTGCVDVCPKDCIEGPLTLGALRGLPAGQRPSALASVQLFINREECIDCAACVSECPAQAIFHEDELPEAHKSSIEENDRFFRQRR